MRFYISTDTQSFITEPSFRAPVNSVSFKRGDTAQVNIQFVSGSTALSAVSGKLLRFGLKEEGDYDGDYVVYQTEYTTSGNDFVMVPSFNTEALNLLLGHDPLSGNILPDVAAVDTMLEVSWSDDSGTSWYSTNTITATINNDVNKGSEGTPIELPDAQDWLDARSSSGGNRTADSGKLLKFTSLGGAYISSRLQMTNSTGNGYLIIDCDNLTSGQEANLTSPIFGGVMKTDSVTNFFSSGATVTVSSYRDTLNVRLAATERGNLNFRLPIASNTRLGQTVGLMSVGSISALSAYSLGGGPIYGNALTAAEPNKYYEFKCVDTTSLGAWIRTL